MGRDWQKAPFTDLQVVIDINCPDGWEPAYERIFNGLQSGCDCLGVDDRWITTDNTFTFGVAGCDYNQTRAGCRHAEPFPPVRMHRIRDRLICGKTGLPFLNVTRPEKLGENWECPTGYSSCGGISDPESMICEKEDQMENCPITDIKFVSNLEHLDSDYLWSYTEFESGISKIGWTKMKP